MKIRLALLSVILFTVSAFGQTGYQDPPKSITDTLNSKGIPQTIVSPAKDTIAVIDPLRYPPISEFAEPMLRLAGLRINPNTNGQHRPAYWTSLSLRDIKTGKERPVSLPPNAQIFSPNWTADGKFLAVANQTATGIELWVVDVTTAKARKIPGVRVNTAFGTFQWMPDQKSLLVNLVPVSRGPAPAYQNVTPIGPNIQEGSGRGGAIQTFQDLLRSPNDEKLFEYYATSQLAVVDMAGKVRNIGAPGILDTSAVSPSGEYFLISRIKKPFSYLFPFFRFPKEVAVWDRNGREVYKVASIPLQEKIPVGGVPTGPRSYGWIPTEPATLIWVEALDEGNPKTKAAFRDKLVKVSAPFSDGPQDLLSVEQRYAGRGFGERDGLMFVYDYNRDTLFERIFVTDYRAEKPTLRMISNVNENDRYNDIGNFVTKRMPNGFSVVAQDGGDVFTSGAGASPEGDRPFLRRFNLASAKSTDMFRSRADHYETFVSFADDKYLNFITRSESVSQPPNLVMNHRCEPKETCLPAPSKKLTEFTDPTPQLRGIKKQRVTYKRDDGIELSFTLYLPPSYKEGTKLPTLLWAYPQEFNDASTAGQVTGSTNRFTSIGGISHLFLLLEGYAIMDNATMPIVGTPETVNETFVQQVVASAKAAIDKGVEMGVVDRDRVAVAGHSYGAFMTGNLLAHSDLFRAGIARSGAYNRTLTPFGFQSERRSFWEAPDMYFRVSPFMYANKINEPILLIHGEADNNQGTFPIQSERLYAAIRGNGGTARLVMLPLESHGYAARESVGHTLYEMVEWMNKHVKNAPPRK